jgi:hypothetical protein
LFLTGYLDRIHDVTRQHDTGTGTGIGGGIAATLVAAGQTENCRYQQDQSQGEYLSLHYIPLH